MHTPTSEHGFTLVELMIASLVTMLLMGVAFTTFKDALAINDAVVNLADSTQNLRAGTNLLVRDLLQAGRNIPTGGIGIPSGLSAEAIHRPSPPGTSLTIDNDDNSTTLTAITTGAGKGPVVAGKPTDLVSIVMGDPFLLEEKIFPSNAPTTLARLAADGTSMNIAPYTDWLAGNKDLQISPLKKGDLILFRSNGGTGGDSGTTIQTVTRINGGTVYFEPNDPFNFNQPNVPQGSITPILPPPCEPPTQNSPPCESGMTIRRVYMYTYFVHIDPESQLPRLMRMTNQFEPQALAGVIEDLGLSYDLVDGTNNPTNVKELPYTANNVTYRANQIRKVNVHVGVRSEVKSARSNDYLRNHLSTVVNIRNLAYVTRYDTDSEE